MYNLHSKGHQRHQNVLISLMLLALIILMGVLYFLGDITKIKVSSSIASDEVVMKNSRLLKEQEQIQEQIKIKNSDLQSILKKQVFNLVNQGKIFGREEKFMIRVDAEGFKRNPDYQIYKSSGIFDRIQVSTPYDYANLTHTVNFAEVSKNMMESVSYELIEFQQAQQVEKLGQLTMETLIKDKKEHASIMKMSNMTDQQLLKRAQYYLAIRLNEDPKSVLLKEAEYLIYDIKYNLSSIAEQLPICIYASGYNLFLKNNYSQFFESINRFNYTNYHIVYVDDNSSPGNIEGILQFLQKGNFRFKNKIKIINNKQHLGSLGNLYIWINKYCNQGDIVIHPDADDWFIGSQVLKVINAAYQNPQIWYAYSKYLKQTGKNNYTNGQSRALQIPVAQYRNTKNWSASHLRTFRKKLFSKISLSYFIQYHLDEATSMAYPTFMNIGADTAQIYSQLQLCGDQRYKHITDYLYLYAGPGTKTFNSKGVNCYRLHEIKDAQKTKIKIPFKVLNTIQQPAQPMQNFVPLQETLDFLGTNYRGYNQCLGDLQKISEVGQEQNSKSITVDNMKIDSKKVDVIKTGNVRVDTVKTDITKEGIIKVDAIKTGIKMDAIKTSTIKVDRTKVDVTKTNTMKLDKDNVKVSNNRS